MTDDNSRARERDVGERIASAIRSIGRGTEKPVTTEERQKLKAAAARLDQMLKAAADADQQALRNAAVRLDEMLADIRKGKDVTSRVKQRREQKEPRQ